MRWRLDKLLPDTRYECLVQVDIKTMLTNFSTNFVIFRPETDTGGVRRARCSRSRLCPTHTKVSSRDWLGGWDWFSLPLSYLFSLVCCDNSQSGVNLSMRFLLPPAFHAIYFVPTRLPFQAGKIYSCLMSREI